MIEDAPKATRGKGGLLTEAKVEALRLGDGYRVLNLIRDPVGVIGFQLLNGAYLVAKRSMRGDLVSVDTELIWAPAHFNELPLIIYLKEGRNNRPGKFYEFKAQELMDMVTVNMRNTRLMTNFRISFGERLREPEVIVLKLPQSIIDNKLEL